MFANVLEHSLESLIHLLHCDLLLLFICLKSGWDQDIQAKKAGYIVELIEKNGQESGMGHDFT